MRGHIKIIARLKIEPELRRRPEIAPQAECGISRHSPATMHDIVQPRPRDLEYLGEPVHAEVQRH